jgi:hypothetical protein
MREAALHSLQDSFPLFQHEPLAVDRGEKHIPRGDAHLPAELCRDDQSSLRSHGYLGRVNKPFHSSLIVPHLGRKCHTALLSGQTPQPSRCVDRTLRSVAELSVLATTAAE